jgi:hypothetical protein
MWPLRVLTEQPSLAAACTAVLSPSAGGWRGLRAPSARVCGPSAGSGSVSGLLRLSHSGNNSAADGSGEAGSGTKRLAAQA